MFVRLCLSRNRTSITITIANSLIHVDYDGKLIEKSIECRLWCSMQFFVEFPFLNANIKIDNYPLRFKELMHVLVIRTIYATSFFFSQRFVEI